jgi:hypothetical protein
MRFAVAEGRCRLWKAGGLLTDKSEHRVADVSRTGLSVLYGSKSKPGTIATAPRKPPWPVGTQVEVALTVGAFSAPIRLVAEIVKIEEPGAGKGCRVGLRIVKAGPDAEQRLKMLEEHEDLRHKRQERGFGV